MLVGWYNFAYKMAFVLKPAADQLLLQMQMLGARTQTTMTTTVFPLSFCHTSSSTTD